MRLSTQQRLGVLECKVTQRPAAAAAHCVADKHQSVIGSTSVKQINYSRSTHKTTTTSTYFTQPTVKHMLLGSAAAASEYVPQLTV
jgi:hypothetical protein